MQSASVVKQDSRSWAANGVDNPANAKSAKPARSSDTKSSSGASANSGSGSNTVFQCSGFGDCRMVFTRSEHLARHVRKHTGERPFQCHCQKAFSRLDNLRQHCQTVHSDTPERNEEILRQLTVLHSNLAASAAKNQRTFARVVIPDGAKPESKAAPDEKKGAPKESAKPTGVSPGGSVAVSSLLSQPVSTDNDSHGAGQDGSLPKNDASSKLLKPTTLPRLDTKSMSRSIQPASFSPHSAPSSSAPIHSLSRPVFGAVASPTHAPLTSPSGVYGRGASEATLWNETRSASALPPLSEISTRLRPSGLAPDARPYTSRSVSIVPDRPPFPLHDQQRRASIPLTGGSSSYPAVPHDLNYHAYYMPHSPRTSYSPSFGSARYSPTMSAEMRWSNPQAKRHSLGYASPPLTSHPRPSLPLPKHALPGKKEVYPAPSSAYSTPADASVLPEAPAVDPLTPVRDSFGERPLKKSRSTYFAEPGSTELASPVASGLPAHAMLKSTSTDASPPTHAPVTRYLPMRHRNHNPNFSLGNAGSPYTVDYDSLRHPAAPRRAAAGFVSLPRDAQACARLDSTRHTAMPVPNGPTSGLEYDEMTQKRNVEEDAC